MKYYSEVLNQLFHSEAECKAEEAKYAEAKKEKEAAANQQNEQMQKLIDTYENKHKALTEQYNATLTLVKEIVNQQDALDRQQKALAKRRMCLNDELRDIARNIQTVAEKLEELKAPNAKKERSVQTSEFQELTEMLETFYNAMLGSVR